MTMEDIASGLDPETLEMIGRNVKEFMRLWLDDFLAEATEIPSLGFVDIQLPLGCGIIVTDFWNN